MSSRVNHIALPVAWFTVLKNGDEGYLLTPSAFACAAPLPHVHVCTARNEHISCRKIQLSVLRQLQPHARTLCICGMYCQQLQ